MNATVLVDGKSYTKDDLEAVLTMMIPDRYPDLWNMYYSAWDYLDNRKKNGK